MPVTTLAMTRMTVIAALVTAFVGGVLCLTVAQPFTSEARGFVSVIVTQTNEFVSNVTTVISTIRENVPAGMNVNLASLTEAEVEILTAQEDIHDIDKDAETAFAGVEMFINAVAAAALSLAALGTLFIILQVWQPVISLLPIYQESHPEN